MSTIDTSIPVRGPRELAVRLIGARSAAGLTQEELADRTGLSVRAIRNLETGRTSRPHPQSLRLLAEALRIHGAELAPRQPAPRGAGTFASLGVHVAPARQPLGSEMPPDAPWLITMASLPIASRVSAVSLRLSPFATLDPLAEKLITSADSRLAAASNDVLVRVESS